MFTDVDSDDTVPHSPRLFTWVKRQTNCCVFQSKNTRLKSVNLSYECCN